MPRLTRFLPALLALLLALPAPWAAQETPAPVDDAPPPWRQRLAHYAQGENWEKPPEKPLPPLTAEMLEEAIEAAGCYLMNQQTPEGNFRYAYDFIADAEENKDNQVRQAGVLWSICNLNRYRFTEETRRSSLLGLDFFLRGQKGLPDAPQIVVTYKSEPIVRTGTAALFCLALLDFLEGQERYLTEVQRRPFLQALENNLKFLQYQELPQGSWREEYELNAIRLPEDIAPFSPYFDGECLLAYAKAARYYKARPDLTPPIPLEARLRDALPKLLRKYTVECFAEGGDTNYTKGFYQWGAMSCHQAALLFQGDPEMESLALEGALALTWWLLYQHKVEARNGNTGYAVEGLAATIFLARQAGRDKEAEKIQQAAERLLARLMTWQVGGPLADYNPLFRAWEGRIPERAFGGITAAADSSLIRIDVVQHQLHAMLLMLQALFPEPRP